MRIRTVNYWLNQIISAEKENIKTKEPQDDKDLSFQIAKYYVSKSSKSKLVA